MPLLFLFLSLIAPINDGSDVSDELLVLASDKPVIDKSDCSCNGKKLYGKVKVVDYAADFNVQVVDYAANFNVQVVSYAANECGKWEFVDYAADFTVHFVDYAAGIK